MNLKPAEQTCLLACCLTIVLLQPFAALAIGLGQAKGDPVIGEALALEVALIEPDRFPLECFHIVPSPNGSDDEYFPRRARLGLKNNGVNKASLTIQAGELKQPVVEFRLTVGCDAQVSRDYTLLASPSRTLHRPPPPPPAPVPPTVAPNLPPATVAPAVAGSALNPALNPAPSLEHLAKQRYPNQPMAREKFKRMMRATNDAILAGIADNDTLPVAVAALHYPPDLPKRRYGPYVPTGTPAKPAPAKPIPARQAEQVEQATIVPHASAKPVATTQDRLTIGSSPDSETTTPAAEAIKEKAAASFTVQDEITDRLAQAEATYQQLKHQVLEMTQRMEALEREKDRLRRENEAKADWSLAKLAGLVLVGGMLGAMLMIAVQRWMARRRETDIARFDIDSGSKHKRIF